MLFIKKYGITCLVLAVVLYILVGAMAPFAGYKKISKETAASVDVNSFFRTRREENGLRFLKPERAPGKNVCGF